MIQIGQTNATIDTLSLALPQLVVGKFDRFNNRKLLILVVFFGAPGVIRTHDLLVRSQTLYPTELRAH